MRERFQKGHLFIRNKKWVFQFWDDGHHKKKTLGPVGKMTKTEAQKAAAAILAPINARAVPASPMCLLAEFILTVYLTFFRRKWKRSTALTNEDRIKHHISSEFGQERLSSFTREKLQAFLDRKAESGLSFSVVDHLRWDLKQIFGMAVAEGFIVRNPAQLLFTPRQCPRPQSTVMCMEEVKKLLVPDLFGLRERLILLLALLAGMRPGEIFALTWERLESEYADIRQRIYRGDIDSPKSVYSVRWAALSDGLLAAIQEWKTMSVDPSATSWVFPSEKLTTPLRKDNCWRRHFKPQLEAVGLGWVNFQVMRRTHSSLLKELDVDPHVRAEQMGHTVDVNENVYTRTSLQRRRDAVNKLEAALTIN
jgi:integrase